MRFFKIIYLFNFIWFSTLLLRISSPVNGKHPILVYVHILKGVDFLFRCLLFLYPYFSTIANTYHFMTVIIIRLCDVHLEELFFFSLSAKSVFGHSQSFINSHFTFLVIRWHQLPKKWMLTLVLECLCLYRILPYFSMTFHCEGSFRKRNGCKANFIQWICSTLRSIDGRVFKHKKISSSDLVICT